MIASGSQISGIFEVDRRTVTNWTLAGCPSLGTGQDRRYDSAAVHRWLVARELAAATPTTGTAAELARAHVRKQEALAALREIEVARLQGELVTLDYLEEQIDRMLAAIACRVHDQPHAILRMLTAAKVIKPRMERRVRRLLEDQNQELLARLQTAGDHIDIDDDSEVTGTEPSVNGGPGI